MRKFISFVAGFALLVNSLGTPAVALAQEITPTYSPAPEVTTQPEATVSPTEAPAQAPAEQGTITETVINNVNLSDINTLNSNVQDSGSISTDQADYSPTGLVLITGSGFIANKEYTIEISSSDQPPVDFTDHVKADDSGKVSYAYQLDGNYRPNYKVEIKDGERLVASTSFTDAPKDPKKDTTTTIASSINPSTFGTSITFTATVKRSNGNDTPTGTVDIKNSSVTICTTGSLTGTSGTSSASCSTSVLTLGAHSINAVYAGDSNFNDSTSTDLSQVVNTRPITITAEAKTKVYGMGDPPLTYQITSGSLIGSDSITGVLARVAGENVGVYAINKGTLTAGSNYNLSYVGANLTITKATPAINWPTPADIIYGTALGSDQLNATSISGSFIYTPNFGTILNAGNSQTLSVNFNPTDTTNYNSNSATVHINVSKADQSALTVTGLPGSATIGQAGITAGTTGGSGTGAVSFSAGSSDACTVNSATGAVSITAQTGNCSITATKAADTNYNSITSSPISITIVPQPFNFIVQNVVCDNAKYTPQWIGTVFVTDHTASDWIAGSEGHCSLDNSWIFQWAQANPADINYGGSYGTPWTSFTAGQTVSMSDLTGITWFKVREVISKSTYLGFGGTPSAQMICSDTGGTFNNSATIAVPAYGSTRYCVAFNAPADTTAPTITLNGDNPMTLTYGSTYVEPGAVVTDPDDTGLSASITGSVNTSILGDYTIYYDAQDPAGNHAVQQSRLVHVVKAIADCSSIGDWTGTYNGNAHGAKGSCIGVGGATVSGLDLGASYTNFPGGPANWSLTNPNYESQSGTVNVTINKANANITLNPYHLDYDGITHIATGTALGVETIQSILTGLLNFSATAHNSAGSFNDLWTFAGNQNYNSTSGTINDVINFVGSTTTITCPASVTYTGSAQKPCTVLVSGAGGLDWTPNSDIVYTNNTNAGTATASYIFTGDLSHTGSSDSKTFIINKANADITVDNYSVSYDGNEHTANGSVMGINSEDLTSLLDLTGTAHINAGTYNSDTWIFTGNQNYNSDSGTLFDQIGRADATFDITPYSVNYDGDVHTALGTATGVKGETLTGLDLTGTTHTNIGDYIDAWNYIDSTGNYNNFGSTINDVINKAPITITADSVGKVLGAADPALTYSVTSGQFFGTDSASGDLARDAGEAVGTYNITQGTLTVDANYLITFVGGTFTISQLDVCTNIDGIQTSVPDGMHINATGHECVNYAVPGENPPPPVSNVLGISTTASGWPQVVLGANTDNENGNEEGSVLGAKTTASPSPSPHATLTPLATANPQSFSLFVWIMGHKKISLGVIIVIVIGGWFIFRKKK